MKEFERLSSEKQRDELKKAWRRLVLQHHPDKNGDAEKFRAVNDAYIALMSRHDKQSDSEDMLGCDIDNYFTKSKIAVPDDAFDIFMHEGITEVFSNLRTQFSGLQSEDEKRQFATYYASFLTLAEELEKREQELMCIRGDALFHQMHRETIGEFIQREWRMLVIRLFAEEYLDDFKYREALAKGDFGPILAIRKLASPIKWLALITASLDLMFHGVADYLTRHRSRFSAAFYLLGAPVSVVNYFVELMAMPVNRIVSPFYRSLPRSLYNLIIVYWGGYNLWDYGGFIDIFPSKHTVSLAYFYHSIKSLFYICCLRVCKIFARFVL